MMNKEIQLLIPKIQQYFAGQPINKAWLFGSCSRGEETSESDIDILVQYADNERVTLFTISRIISSLKKILKRSVDLVDEDGLLPFAIDSVQQDKILIYERNN